MQNITDEAVECIKIIVDNNRCETCDTIEGERVRYQCGHCFCGECVAKVEHCLLCLTPPESTSQKPLPDNHAARRASNAAKLLKVFEDAFGVDVYKRSRISEQLKVEKELFPDCIQAPFKYHNKRKSSTLQLNKENRGPSFFPGELISPGKAIKMENSHNYVQRWLDNQKETPKMSPRKPFADLNVNSPNQFKRRISKRADIILDKAKENSEITPRKKRKITSFTPALAVVESQSLLDTHFKPIDKGKEFTKIKKGFDESSKVIATKVLNKTDKDESGIVIDDDPIVIDDSQSQVIDKDKLAWLAVLEAAEKSPYDSQSIREDSEVIERNNYIDMSQSISQPTASTKVPFYKRSYLKETCDLCKASKSDIVAKKQVAGKPKEVSITIESSRFITTIKMSTVQDKPLYEKHSVPVQTDACSLVIPNQITSPDNILSKKMSQKNIEAVDSKSGKNKEKESPSQDLFTGEMKSVEDHKTKLFAKEAINESPHLVIEDSDSDDAANESSIIQVTAEIHHSNEQLEPGVLAELEQSEMQQRGKRSGRGHTPNSSNSSDKENFDPNRPKRMKLDKKDSIKRKKYSKIKKLRQF